MTIFFFKNGFERATIGLLLLALTIWYDEAHYNTVVYIKIKLVLEFNYYKYLNVKIKLVKNILGS